MCLGDGLVKEFHFIFESLDDRKREKTVRYEWKLKCYEGGVWKNGKGGLKEVEMKFGELMKMSGREMKEQCAYKREKTKLLRKVPKTPRNELGF